VIEHSTAKVGLGIIHCLLKERGELSQLISTIEEVVEEDLEFSGDIRSMRASQLVDS
jgi:hypothetical protein